MLDQALRATILRLRDKGHSKRQIARALGVSRAAVRRVLAAGSAEPPSLTRPEKAEPFREEMGELLRRCRGNLVRVHEELLARGAQLSYSALTRFCRQHHIGQPPPRPVGRYPFEPAQEMQHDSSPHSALLGGKSTLVQTASLAFCFSRMLFFQHYPSFNRFYCKVFLTDALVYFQGACQDCLIDNTHVVVLRGSGAQMVPVPEMEAFAERFGFVFRAHEPGDANRSAHVERSMHTIETNFLAGREFRDFSDLNQQAVAFCDRLNASWKRHLRASPRELFAIEQARLRPLPVYVPEVYQLHHRIVDTEGYVCLHSNRYSAPYTLIGKTLEVRETKDRVDLFDAPRRVGSHPKSWSSTPMRVCAPEHRAPRGQGPYRQQASPEEQELQRWGEPLTSYAGLLKKRASGPGRLVLRRLLSLARDYPRQAFLQAVQTALHYGLYDLQRLERLILRAVAGEYFILSPPPEASNDDE